MPRPFMPLVVSVCTDCEQPVRDLVEEAYEAGRQAALLQARFANKYWAKDLELLMYPP